MSMQQLIVCLEKLQKLHESLLQLAREKTEMIKTNDMEGLQKITSNEQKHIRAISTLELQRDQLAHELVDGQEDVTVSACIEAAVGEERSQLEQLRDMLLQTVDKLKEQNELNQLMIYQSLQYINLTLDAIYPQKQPTTYAPPEKRQLQTNISRFDSKA
ncbi:flagellar protein FlgN [Heyndrickxia ginsengihumi]|uniref:Flagellar biosynthesis protein FlgN n=1 Tax=Heyndrickxia ginsengihumi TaxID=363870 RepID=A0A0A6VFR6_9BACI|nr:flagellar protein FlgN [Heyndrickxia ginsengihumi]KHD86416.1 flagellar biosynthesis protein FlgN [Heyndrickxia ginsengihumi]